MVSARASSVTQRPGEFALIADYFAPLAGEGTFGLKDDAATFSVEPGHQLVITQDASAENIHFLDDDPADLVARKALRVNLSDLAAKGARAKCFSVALGLGEDWTEEWIRQFAQGLREDIDQYDIALTGGDTFKTGGGMVISITAIGEIPRDSYVARIGASPGDQLFVTGTIGDGALGLLARRNDLSGISMQDRKYLVDRYQLPQPRLEFAHALRKVATSAMDVSDGLLGDLVKLCDASGVSAELVLSKLPFSSAVKTALEHESNLLETAVTGGDDYEILFTVSPENVGQLMKLANEARIAVTCIGEITSGEGISVFDRHGEKVEFPSLGYDHSGARN